MLHQKIVSLQLILLMLLLIIGINILIDYIIYCAYINEKQFKNIVDSIPFINCNIYLLEDELNSDFHKKFFKCPFNKLERIVNENVFNNSKSNNYRYIIENNKFKYKFI